MTTDPHNPGRTILLAEDSDRIRHLVKEILGDLRWGILEAARADEALAVAAAQPESIDLLVTDLEMPGMSGIELARRLRERYPNMKVLCMSGYALPAAPSGDIHFIEKPFAPDVLLGRIRQLFVNEA